MRLLLVEDEPGIAQFISQGLQEAGDNVDVTTDGKHGWDYVSSLDYDLIILDILLPHIVAGFQLLRKIRNQQISTPVLLLTARDHVSDRLQGLDDRADDYLVKPFAFTVLQITDLTMDKVKREVRRGV